MVCSGKLKRETFRTGQFKMKRKKEIISQHDKIE